MNLKKVTALLLASAMFAGCMTGCGGGDNSSSSSNTETGAVQSEQTEQASNHLNMAIMMKAYMPNVKDSYSDCWQSMRFGETECLTKVAQDGSIEPWLAKSWESSDDYKTWTIELRSDVKFSNGEAMTAQKVVDSLNYIYDYNDPEKGGDDGTGGPDALVNFMVRPAAITADDAANTVTLEFDSAVATVPGALSNPAFAIIDWEASEGLDHANKGEIATGPYVFDQVIDGHSVELVKNEYYYEEVPYDTVSLLGMEDSATASMAIQDGSVDVAFNLAAADNTSLQGMGCDVSITSGSRTGFFFLNHEGVLGNDDLRKAIIKAIDWKTIDEITVGGSYIYGYAPISESFKEYGGDVENPLNYDVEAAVKMLDDAGIVDNDGDGIRELDGKNIELNWSTNKSRQMDMLADAAIPMLQEIGINATHNFIDDQMQTAESGNYDLVNWNQVTIQCGNGVNFMRQFLSTSTSNYGKYNNPAYDEEFAKLDATYDEAEMGQIISNLQKILIDDGAIMVNGYYQFNSVNSARATGAVANGIADYYWLTNKIKPAN